MNKKINVVLFALFLISLCAISSFFILKPKTSFANTNVTVDFFYGDGCPHCALVEPLIKDLEIKFPQVLFNSYEVYHNQDNALLLFKAYDKYKVSQKDQGGVPIVFIGDEYFLGDRPIIDNLENKIVANLLLKPSNVDINKPVTPVVDPVDIKKTNLIIPTENTENFNNQETNINTNKSYSLWAIAGAAVVDSINPCAIAVLLILLTALMMGAGNRKRALYGGLAFTFSLYITYFLFGLGLLQLIAITNIANIIAKIVGIIALIIGLANIKDFFFYGGGGFVMEIPRNWRPALKKILNGVTSPLGAFFAGFVITIFELPCTGGPYFFVIGLLSQSENIKSVIPTLLFYNIVFVLPLLIIVFIFYFGVSSLEKAEAWKEKNIKKLHLFAGIIMLALGIWVFFV